MFNQPLVSIIIPTYNYGHLISETLNSLLNQSYQNWEAIIIDDGSTDDTKEVVNRFTKIDNRFTYYYRTNCGVSASRNFGLKLAKGEYLQFLDADDLLSKKKIELQVALLEQNPSISLALCQTKYFESSITRLYTSLDKKNTSCSPELNGKGFSVVESFIKSNQCVIQSPLFPSCILQKIGFFNEEMNYLEDWDFWIRCAINNLKFSFLNNEDCYSLVRIHSASASKVSNRIYEAEGNLRNKINYYIVNSGFNIQQKSILLKANKRELIKTYKVLMSKTNLMLINKWYAYYMQINSFSVFCSCFIKALNIKRKSNGFIKN